MTLVRQESEDAPARSIFIIFILLGTKCAESQTFFKEASRQHEKTLP